MNDNSISTVLNLAFQQSVGETSVGKLGIGDFIDTGKAFTDFTLSRELFTKALIEVLFRNIFTDSDYSEVYKDPFFKDSAEFGAIMQAIHVELPTVEPSLAWQDFSINTTVGSYTVYIPTVVTKLYDKSDSWQIPLWISDEQLATAFRSEDEVRSFVSYLFLSAKNAVTKHLEIMNEANRNNFIAQKVDYASSVDATGFHVINLADAYVNEVLGGASKLAEDLTPETFMANKDMLIFGARKILEYTTYLQKMTVLFNTEGAERFTPRERLVVQILNYFEKAYNSIARSSTFHDELIKFPEYQEVAFWQGFGDGSFADLSSIDVSYGSGLDEKEVAKSGIVAFVCDEYAIMHTIKKHRVASRVFEPEALTAYYYQFRDSYANNLSLNALVFTVETVEAESA